MSAVFADSFDNYTTTTTQVLGKWLSNSLVDASLTFPATGRNGSNCFHWVIGGIAPSMSSYVSRTFTASQTTIIIGFALRIDSFDPTQGIPFFQFDDIVTPQVTV